MDKLNLADTVGLFTNAARCFTKKSHFNKHLSEERIVELLASIYYMKFKNEEHANNPKVNDARGFEVMNLLPKECAARFESIEWNKKVTAYLLKNFLGKKQNETIYKKKILGYLKDSRTFASNVYDYTMKRSKIDNLSRDGVVSVNSLGIHFFNRHEYRTSELTVALHDILEYEPRGRRVKLKIMQSREPFAFFVNLASSRQFCEDIATYQILAMRENRNIYYAYSYLAKVFPRGGLTNDYSALEQTHLQKILRCNEVLHNFGDSLLEYNNLPFTYHYHLHITVAETKLLTVYYQFKKADLGKEPSQQTAKRIKRDGTKLLPMKKESGASSPVKQLLPQPTEFIKEAEDDDQEEQDTPNDASKPGNFLLDPKLSGLKSRSRPRR